MFKQGVGYQVIMNFIYFVTSEINVDENKGFYVDRHEEIQIQSGS